MVDGVEPWDWSEKAEKGEAQTDKGMLLKEKFHWFSLHLKI